jgi:GT2 family glycosyltransferase
MVHVPEPGFDELIVVDSTTDPEQASKTRQLVNSMNGQYVFENRRGLSVARNTGIRVSRGELVAFADDDFIVERNWVSNLVKNYSDRRVACCTGRMMPYRSDEVTRVYESSMSFDKGPRRRKFSKEDMDILNLLGTVLKIGQKRLNDATPVPWSVGFGFFSCRRSVFSAVGLFDEKLGRGAPGMACEDLDMFYRILKAGYEIVYEPLARVYHVHRQTHGEILNDAFANGMGNRSLISKHAKTDPYALALMVGSILFYCLGYAGSFYRAGHDLRKMILYESGGFLKGRSL